MQFSEQKITFTEKAKKKERKKERKKRNGISDPFPRKEKTKNTRK